MDGVNKADELARELKNILREGVKIARPSASGELRISGLDDATDVAEVRAAISDDSRCCPSE